MDPDSKRGRRAARLHVSVTDGLGRPARDGGLSRWLASIAPSAARGDVAVALVTDAHSHKLNSQYRRKDRPTDVLSFPADSVSQTTESRQSRRVLGDIVIATGTARKQARAAGHSYQTELRVLALHGLLHLLGYDHDNGADAGRMRRLETRLRRRGGLRAGLIERS